MTCRLSANLIARNEQRTIARCLESIEWCDEIVVIDGGSTDRTVEIARDFSDQVAVHPFDNFASQRNRAIERSSGDWILSVDCDEWISPALAREVRQKIEAAPESCHGFWVPIRSRIFGRPFRYSGTQGERKLRLFRRHFGRWTGALHETLKLNGLRSSLQNAIEHESTPDIDTYLRKLMQYSSLEAESIVASGTATSWPHQWLKPVWQFARLYFGKLGFLDGPEGFRFCLLSAWQVWITHQKVIERTVAMGASRLAEVDGRCHGPAPLAA
jgi:glycosyltransferase involved in cell wall biosynthesis